MIKQNQFLNIYNRKGTIIFLLHKKAYKIFYGSNASTFLNREIQGYEVAHNCPIWKTFILPIEKTILPRTLCSPRVYSIPLQEEELTQRMETFIEKQLQMAVSESSTASAWTIINHNKLRVALGEVDFTALRKNMERLLKPIILPLGSAHGDLHRGNIGLLNHKFCIFDCDRFALNSSPLFDYVHFLLSERQQKLKVKKRWLDLLEVSEDLLDIATGGMLLPEDLAVAYGFNRIALEGYAAYAKGKSCQKYLNFANRLLQFK